MMERNLIEMPQQVAFHQGLHICKYKNNIQPKYTFFTDFLLTFSKLHNRQFINMYRVFYYKFGNVREVLWK